MFAIVHTLTVIVVALAMALAVAHALEMPGKMRLSRDEYFVVQPIYYPGFTIGGISEPAGLASALVLLFLTSVGSAAFWLIVMVLVGLAGMQGVYWLVVHPVNRIWLRGDRLGQYGSSFFLSGKPTVKDADVAWTTLRDRCEYGHVARALLGALSFVALLVMKP